MVTITTGGLQQSGGAHQTITTAGLTQWIANVTGFRTAFAGKKALFQKDLEDHNETIATSRRDV